MTKTLMSVYGNPDSEDYPDLQITEEDLRAAFDGLYERSPTDPYSRLQIERLKRIGTVENAMQLLTYAVEFLSKYFDSDESKEVYENTAQKVIDDDRADLINLLGLAKYIEEDKIARGVIYVLSRSADILNANTKSPTLATVARAELRALTERVARLRLSLAAAVLLILGSGAVHVARETSRDSYSLSAADTFNTQDLNICFDPSKIPEIALGPDATSLE